MKKIVIFLVAAVAAVQSLSAQRYNGANSGWWIDAQAVESFGINPWSDLGYVQEGFPPASLTELRAVLNGYLIYQSVGAFLDMGLGVMPAPPMRKFGDAPLPPPETGHNYYTRNVTEDGESRASAHFRISAGLFGEIQATQRLAIMPYAGVGGMTMTRRTFDVRYKEDGSNTEYNTRYAWGRHRGDEFGGNGEMLGYFNGRLNCRYELDSNTYLTVGLEYTHFWDSTYFFADFNHAYNANVQRQNPPVKCKKMNMLGLSVGVSFR
jgi:hypothetical protein